MGSARNLFSRFREQFERNGAKAALMLPGGQTVSYAELDARSAQFANLLDSLGFQPGERVTAQVPKSAEALYLYLACLRGGYVFHPLNTGYQRAELAFFLGDAQPALVVCAQESYGLFEELCEEHDVQSLLTLNGDGTGSLVERCQKQSKLHEPHGAYAGSPAALLYSSGTTGVPKGIVLSNENLLSNGETLVKIWGFDENDVLLHALPIYHVHGLFVAVSCALLSGASMRWLEAFDLEQVLADLPLCTVMMGVPTYYTRLLSDIRLSRERCSSLRVFISGSAPLLLETFTEFEARTGHRILERYGMSEAGMITSNPLYGQRLPGTVGLPLPEVDVRVVDDSGQPCSGESVGMVQVRGPNVFSGYWKLPDKTMEDFTKDGFFQTGDLGSINEMGYLSIVGRAKDLIISGGLNVYPKEVELVIDELPEVLESAVIGVPHKDFGEAVVAVIVPAGAASENPNETELIETLKGQISGFKVPKRIVATEELPRNAMGKVQKKLLRERYARLLS
ncbi:MAG: AMP-binding protein [Pseudomonadota bacterium]